MTSLVEPQDDQRVKHQRHRRGSFDGLRLAIGGVLEPQQLFRIFEANFDRPTPGITRKNLPSVQFRLVQ